MFHAMLRGAFEYVFNEPPRRNADTASRATILQFQTYPANNVQGAGDLVSPNGHANNMWRTQQPPQLIEVHAPIVASLLAGGTPHSVIENQSLLDTSKSTFG